MIPRLKHALHRLQAPQRYRFFDGLMQNQRLGRDALAERQRHALRGIVDHAARHSPYYRERYSGLDLDRFEGLPILTKDAIFEHRDRILDETVDRSRIRLGYTGGSTGRPLAYWYDDAKHELMRAAVARSYTWTGWRPGQKVLNLWGARQDLKGDTLKKRLGDWIGAVETIGAYEYSEAELAAWSTRIKQWRPVIIQGYASIIAELARFIVDQRIAMPESVIAVYTTAEVLYDHQRELIGRAFRCKVYNQYGCREIPNISVECPLGNQHILTDMAHVESLQVDGEERLIVTALTERTFPFIRYQLGDSGRLKEGACPCGSPFPLMEIGQCRSNDLIRTPSGRKIHPSRLNRLLDGLTGIRQYQFVQRALDRITLSLVTPERLPAETVAAMRHRLREVTHEGMALEIEYPAEIPRTASGKHRFVICELK